GTRGFTPEDAQHRDHGAHRRRQDDDDRAHPLLHGPHAQARRGSRGRGDDGLDGAGAGARHHDHLCRHHRRVARPPGQHHRHARPCRLHRRGRALAARARRRGRGVRLRCRRRAPVRDRLAPGRQVPRAADRLHQQDGPHRRGLRHERAHDHRASRGEPDPRPAAGRLGVRLPGHRRPDQHEGDHVLRRPRSRVDGRGHPRRDGRRRRCGAHPPARGRRGVRRRAHGGLPGRGGDRRRSAARGHPPGDARHLDHSAAVWLLLQEQGRSAAARRSCRLPAESARRPPGRGPRDRQGRRRPPGQPPRLRRPAVLGARLQGHVRPVRWQAHLLPRLLGPARERQPGAQLGQRADRARRAHPHDARQFARGQGRGLRRRHRRGGRAQADLDRRHPLRTRRADQARDHHLPGAGRARLDRAQDQGRPGEDGHRARPPRRGGPDLPGPHRRGDRPDGHLGDGRAPSRGPRRPHAARVQRRGRGRAPPGRLPRDGPWRGHEDRGQVHPPDRRLGPVRRGLHQHGAVSRRGLRVRQQDPGRLGPLRVHPGGREGRRGGARDRRQGGLSDGRRARDPDRRQVPRHRLLGDRLQDR
ncbi:MAG: Translation elongation factor G, partial [uncultured Solirubrobacterales bacterium]